MKEFDVIYNHAIKRCPNQEYIDRLKFEYDQIKKLGVEQYWVDLIKVRLKDGKKYITNKNGLILPYLLCITNIDPIKEKIPHNIRRDYDFPDIDIDYIPAAREIIKTYAAKKYGKDKVCSVGLWQTYNPKSALQDVARALGFDDKKRELIGITTALPAEFDDMDFEHAYSNDFEGFKQWVDEDPINRRIAEKAFKLVGKIKTQGKHAGGLIISRVPLKDHLPLAALDISKKSSSPDDVQWTSEWTEGSNVQLSKFGFVKYDVLGLKTLNYIWEATKIIKRVKNIDIDWNEIGYDDENALGLANKLKTDSIFQFDTDTSKGILSKGGVKTLHDLMVYTSLGRPGPMPMIDVYIERRDNKKQNWESEEHPSILKLLQDTFAVCVYQEQVTEILTQFAGFSIPEADKARKIMSKKWADQMVWVREKILKGLTKSLDNHDCPLDHPHIDPDDKEKMENMKLINEICGTERWTWAKEYWKRLETFARYSFNRSHAISYALHSYRCLYLKAHHPEEWWCAVLNSCDIDRRAGYIGAARADGVQFGTINIHNLSEKFDVANNTIIPGILGIKGIGKSTISKINFDMQYGNTDGAVSDIGKSKTLFERLIKLGAFDTENKNRNLLWNWYLYKYGSGKDATTVRKAINGKRQWPEDKIKKERQRLADEYKANNPNKKIPNRISNWKPKTNKSLEFDEFCELTSIKDFAYDEKLEFQREYLGYHWDSPMELYRHTNQNIKEAKSSGILECVITKAEYRKTSGDKRFLSLTVTDGTEFAKIQVWNDKILEATNRLGDDIFDQWSGIKLEVSWNPDYKSFTIRRYSDIMRLRKKE